MSIPGSRHFAISYRLTVGAFLAAVFLLVCLLARPTPMGTPYVVEWVPYLARGVFLEALVTFALATPFLLFWLFGYRRLWRWDRSRWVHVAQGAILALNLALNHLDHEIMRFVGTHPTRSFLKTYGGGGASWHMIVDSLWLDNGGPGVSVAILLLVPALYVLWGRRSLGAGPGRTAREWSVGVAVLAVLLPIAIPLGVHARGTGQGRTRRMKPYLMTVAEEWSRAHRASTPAERAQLVTGYQRRWLAENGGPGWRFSDPARPFVREPARPRSSPEGQQWNVIVVQLETFRAWNMGLMQEGLVRSATPFIDSLGRSPAGAYWVRHFGFGLSTANAFVGWHCSLRPHSGALVASTFAYANVRSLPAALRQHGYRAEAFLNGDPDWDNQRVWFERWYDRYWVLPGADEVDRPLFRRASNRIRELGRSGRPFFASIISASNHHPFRSREPWLNISGSGTPASRILNTMYYTDDVVREFVEGLRDEPFWNRTLLVLFGDHGYNLGERPNRSGQMSLYRESTWVPLVIVGNHPELAKGRHEEPASLIDIAPTVAGLLGIAEATPWQGHDLALAPRPSATASFAREEVAFVETSRISLVAEHDVGAVRVFDPAADPLQERPLSNPSLDAEAAGLLRDAEETRRLNDRLIETNRIW